jgi:hypothetical protein
MPHSDGGESGLLDGYTAAATLRAEDPACEIRIALKRYILSGLN